MALPSSGPLTLTDIQTEFGGSNPIGLNEYYAGGSYVPSGTTGTYGAVPSSGTIGIRNFYGTQKLVLKYRGSITYTATANSWYKATGVVRVWANSYTNSSSSGAFICLTNNGTSGTTTGTRRGGFSVFDMATNSYTGAYGFNTLAGGMSSFFAYFMDGDQWGNIWGTVFNNTQPPSRAVRLSVDNNYSSITHQWSFSQVSAFNTSNGNTQVIKTVNPNVSYSFPGQSAYGWYILGVTQSGGITTYNPSPSYSTGSSTFVGSNSTSANNEIIFSVWAPSIAGGTTTAMSVLNRCDSNMNLLGQSILNLPDVTTTTGQGLLNISAGKISNLLYVWGNGRFGGTTSTFNRAFQGWFSLGSSGSLPALISMTRSNSTVETQSPAMMQNLIAIKDGYEYWSGFFNASTQPYVFKINSSGTILEGWRYTGSVTNNVIPKALDENGTLFLGSDVNGFYTGTADITKLLNNQYTGYSFTSNSTYNGTLITSISGYTVSMTASFNSYSSPLVKNTGATTVTPTGPTPTSDQTTFTATATDMFGPVVVG